MPLLAGLESNKVLADKVYGSEATRVCCTKKGIEAVIPSHSGRTEVLPMDKETCRDRNKVERFFGRFKQYRRLATHYEKIVISFLVFWHIADAIN